jgi:hypothetical protein
MGFQRAMVPIAAKWCRQIRNIYDAICARPYIPVWPLTFVNEPLDYVELWLKPRYMRVEEEKAVKPNLRNRPEVPIKTT